MTESGSGLTDSRYVALQHQGSRVILSDVPFSDVYREGEGAKAGMAQAGQLAVQTDRPVVLMAAAAGLIDFIGTHGGDVDAVFGRCGVAPEMTTAPTLQLPLATFCDLFEGAARDTGCDNFGLLFGQQFQPRDLGMWGYAALSSPTLGSALENLVGLFRYQQSSSTMRIVQEDARRVRLDYQIHTPAIIARRQDAELSLGQFVNLIRECCGRSWSPVEIQFEHPKPEEWRQHETAFGAPVFFGCDSNSIVFDPALLDRPMPGRDLKLLTVMQSCLELLGSPERDEPLIDRVRGTVRQITARRRSDAGRSRSGFASGAQCYQAGTS